MTRISRTLTGLLAAIALAIGGLAVSAPAASADDHMGEDVTLVVTELPAQVRLIPGESIELTLVTNRTTGYSWKARVRGDKKAIKVGKGKYTAPEDSGMVGVPGTTTWKITAEEPGRAVVRILATPPGGGDPEVSKLTVIVMNP